MTFDANAFTYLMYRDAVASWARHTLRKLIALRRIEFVLTFPLLSEVAGTFSQQPPLFHRLRREALRLSRGRVLRPSEDREALEARKGRPLYDRESFFSPRDTEELFKAFATGSLATHEADWVKQVKDTFAAEEFRRKDELRAQQDDDGASAWRQSFRSAPDSHIEDWARDKLRQYGASDDVSPRSLPTLWASMSYHLARLYIYALDGQGKGKLDGNDIFDRQHFADGACADMLISSDKKLARIAALVPASRVRVVSFHEWATAIGR